MIVCKNDCSNCTTFSTSSLPQTSRMVTFTNKKKQWLPVTPPIIRDRQYNITLPGINDFR